MRFSTVLAVALVGALALVYSLDEKLTSFNDATIYFAVKPAEGHPPAGNRVYPLGTRLFRLEEGSSATPLEVEPRLDLASPVHVAYDGTTLLFAARMEGESSDQVWEMDADGTGLSRLTDLSMQISTPFYLPGGQVVFSGLSASEQNVSSLYRWDRETDHLERITFGPGIDQVREILPDGRILFSRGVETGAELTVLRPDGTEMDAYLKAPGGSTSLDPQFGQHLSQALRQLDEQGLIAIDPVKTVPRPTPPVATSIVDPNARQGWLLCLDSNFGENPLDDSRPEAAFVRVIDARTGHELKTFKVEKDGSFFAEVPADRLLRLETLDQNRQMIARQTSGIWVRPNEHRGCAGCHEPRNMTPENRFPLAIEKNPISVKGLEGNRKGEWQ